MTTVAKQLREISDHLDMALQRIDTLHVKVNTMSNQLATISALEAAQTQKEATIMADLSTMIAQQQAALAAIARNKDLDDSIIALVTANTATIQSLKDQLAAAIAAGADPVQLQALSDSIDAALAGELAEGDKVSAAVTANTPAA